MNDIAIIEPNEDVYDVKDVELIDKVYQQLQFFDIATKEDIRKTLFLLSMFRAINKMIENYEFVLNETAEDGMNEYDMSAAEGRGKRIDPTDLVSDVKANKRRKVIASLANCLLLNGMLDFVIIRYGRRRNENGEIGLRL
jgi:hypothetical protein